MPPRRALPQATPDELEQQFYEALQQADLDLMMAVWADDEDIACVHPNGQRLVGLGAVRSSFEALFASGAVQAHCERVRRLETDHAAVHHVLERLHATTQDGVTTAWVLATNVYLKTAAGWRMVLHHASAGSPHDVQTEVEVPSTLH